jgi:uncharacterized protein YigE (DUF2233 family)
MMKKYSGIAIAIEDCAALQILGDQYRIINSDINAKAFKVYWKNGKFYETQITQTNMFRSLNELLKK